MTRPDTKAARARADAATAAVSGGDQAGMRFSDRVGTIIFAFSAFDARRQSLRDLVERVRGLEASAADVPALCDRVEALEAALRRLVPVLDSCVTAACAKVPPDYAETVDALDDVRAALEGEP
jgi:hypothetical protein